MATNEVACKNEAQIIYPKLISHWHKEREIY